MRRKHNFLARILVLFLCVSMLTGNLPGLISFADENSSSVDQPMNQGNPADPSDGSDSDDSADPAGVSDSGNPADPAGGSVSGQAAGAPGSAQDPMDDPSGDEGEDALTPEQEEELQRWLEENGGVMPLAAGDPISITGAIAWEGDGYWKSQIRPSDDDIKGMIKLYAVPVGGGAETPVSIPSLQIWDADGKTGYRIEGVAEPDPAAVTYIVRVDGLASYTLAYDGGEDHAVADFEMDNLGIVTGMKATDVKATMATQPMTIENHYYGGGTATFTYGVKAGKVTGTEADFHGTYDNGAPQTTTNGKVTVTAADGDGTAKTITVDVPVGLKMAVASQTDGYITVKEEVKDTGGNVTGYVFSHINSQKAVKATKRWNDNQRPYLLRPAITLKVYFTVAGGEETVLDDTTKAQIGLGDQQVPVPQRKQIDINHVEYTFSGLPECVVDGTDVKRITYTIKEEPVPGYQSVTKIDGTGITITNTYTTNLEASIVWKDGADEVYPFRPDSVNLELKRYTDDPENFETVPVDQYEDRLAITGINSKTWTVSIQGLPGYADADGYPYTYFLTETPPVIKPVSDDGENAPAGTSYGEATYTNTNDHAQVTDKCFSGGTIINTKVAEVSFDAQYKWTSDDNRPEAKIYLYRYIKGGNPASAASVRIPNPADPDGEWVLEYEEVENDTAAAPTRTPVGFSFDNLPKYDSEGYEYVYIAKAVAEGNDYMYYYPEGQDYGVEENGTIVFVPQKTVEKKFSLTWNSAAFPNVPTGWTENVVLQYQGEDGQWKDVSGPQYTGYTDLKFTNFNPGETTKEITAFLPMYGRNGEELNYRIAMVDLQQGLTHVTTQEEDGRNLFTIGGRQYEATVDPEGNLVNSLYNKLQYRVTKLWNDQRDSDTAYANVQLLSGTDVVTGLDQQPCTATLNKDGNWTYTFVVNRYDALGRERSLTVQETGFDPAQDDNGDAYVSYFTYGRDLVNDSILTANIVNRVPTGTDKYISVKKVWLDGGDIEDREPITVRWTDTSDGYSEEKSIGPGTQWKSDINIKNRNPADIAVEEIKVGDADVEADGTVTLGAAIYETAVTRDGNQFQVTNTRTGNVKIAAEIHWSDGSDPANRPNVKAILQMRDASGAWVDYTPLGAPGYVELTAGDMLGSTGNDKNVWKAYFKDDDDNDLLLPKYDATGNVISYNFRIEYTNNATETYETTLEDSKYAPTQQAGVPDVFTKFFVLTRHSSKEVVIHKRWMGDQVKEQPDIYLTLKRGTKDAEGNMPGPEDLEDYDALETEFGKIEMVIEKEDDFNYIYRIRNLEKHTETGEEYMYYVTENMDNPNGYKGYYFDKEADIAGWKTTNLNQQYVLTGGWIVNRQEGTMKISGSKQWQDLEPGTRDESLPSPTIQLFRKVTDANGAEIEDAAFRNEEHKIVLDTNKRSWSFPEDGTSELPIYDDMGRKYTYWVEETLTQVADRVYFKSAKDDFSLLNQYITSAGNTRKITVTKTWDSDISIPRAKYPQVTYELYRYSADPDGVKDVEQLRTEAQQTAKNDTNNTQGEKVGTCTLQLGDAVGTTSQVSYTFDDLRIAAPSGADYVYKVVERTLDGYLAEGAVKDDSGKYAKTVMEIVAVDKSNTTTVSDTPVGFGNQYVGDIIKDSKQPNPSVTIEGVKNWHDTGYTNLRPAGDIPLHLYRYADTASGTNVSYEEVIIDGTNVTIEWTNKTDGSGNPTYQWNYEIKEGGGVQGSGQTQLLTYAPNGARYKYFVTEDNIPNYEKTQDKRVYQNAANDVTHVITMKPLDNYMNLSIKVDKVWADSGNTYGLRPDEITVQLQRSAKNPDDPTFVESDWKDVEHDGSNGTGDGEQIITKDMGWTYTYKRLPAMTKTGEPCYYRVIETGIGGIPIVGAGGNKSPYEDTTDYIYAQMTTTEGKAVLTNTLQPVSLSVTKEWVGDQDDKYNTRPKSGNTKNWAVTIQLQKKLATGTNDWTTETGWERVTERTITGSPTSPSTTITYSGLPKCTNDGTQILYRAVEIGVPQNYTMTATHRQVVTAGAQSSYESKITNTLQVDPARKDVTVKKIWNPDGAKDNAYKVTMELQQQAAGESTWKPVNAAVATQVLTKAGNWEYTWNDVPKLTAGGKAITYRVVEKKIEDGATNITSRFQNVVASNATSGNVQTIQIRNTELIDYAFTLGWVGNDFGLTNQADFTLYRIKSSAPGAASSAQADTTGWEKVTTNAAATPVAVQPVSKTGNVTGTVAQTIVWKDLPKYADDGTEYIYQVVENKIGGQAIPSPLTADNYKAYTISNQRQATTAASGATKEVQRAAVINTLATTTKTATKEWDFEDLNGALYDAANPDATETYRLTLLPPALTVTLMANTGPLGAYVNVAKLPANQAQGYTFTPGDPRTEDWTYQYANLPRYQLSGTAEIQYRVMETLPADTNFDKALDKTETYATSAAEANVTTLSNAITTKNLTGTKTWSDFGNLYELRPDQLTLTVKENGVAMNPQPIIVWSPTAASGNTGTTTLWTYSIAGLPKYVWDGANNKYREAVYQVVETAPARYWQKTDDVAANKNGNFINQLCVIELWHTEKQVGSTTPATLTGATFTITGDFQTADGSTAAGQTVSLTLDDGRMVLTPDALGNGYSLMPGKTYTVTQTTAVDGYQRIDGTVTFSVDVNGVITVANPAKMQDNDDPAQYSNAAKVIAKTDAKPAILQIQNCKTVAKVKLTKVDKDDHTITLPGVKFKLYKQVGADANAVNDQVITATGQVDAGKTTVLTTDANGQIQIAGLGEGTYYFVEEETLGNYQVDNTANEFTVDYDDHWTGAAKTISVLMENEKLDLNLQLKKVDAVTGDPIKGVRFQITYEDEAHQVSTFEAITGADGVLKKPSGADLEIIELEKGTYTVEEIAAVTGYNLESNGKPFKCTFTVADNTGLHAIFINEKWLNTTNTTMPSATPQTNAQVIQFQCESQVYDDFLQRPGGQGAGVYNSRIPGSISLQKADVNMGQFLNDVEFKLEKKQGDAWVSYLTSFKTGQTYQVTGALTAASTATVGEGKLEISGLEWGQYRITETKPNPGYIAFAGGPSYEFTVMGGQGNTIDWTLVTGGSAVLANDLSAIKIGVEETPGAGVEKAGVELTLEGKFADDPSVTQTIAWTSGANLEEFEGSLIVGNTYTLSQGARPDGYEAWKQPIKFHLDVMGNIVFETGEPADLSDNLPVARTDDADKTLWVRHTKVNAKLRIEKTGAGGKLLEGVTFDLYRKDGTPTGIQLTPPAPIETDAQGVWESDPRFLELPEGEYYLEETWTSALYRPNTERIDFTVTANDHFATTGRPVTVKVVNIPQLNLIDVNTENAPLGGYVFQVTGIFNDLVPGADPGDDPGEEQTLILSKETLEEFNRLLIRGNRYVMKQVAIDDGYYLNGTTEFVVNTDYSVDMTDTAEYQFDAATRTLKVINRPIPKPQPQEVLGANRPRVPVYTSPEDVPDPNVPGTPGEIILVRGGESKTFTKTWMDGHYVYRADDGEVLPITSGTGVKTGDMARTGSYYFLLTTACVLLWAQLRHRRKWGKR